MPGAAAGPISDPLLVSHRFTGKKAIAPVWECPIDDLFKRD